MAIVFVGLLVVIGAAIYAIIPPIVNEVGTFASIGAAVDHRSAEQLRASGIWTPSSGILNAIQNSNIVQTLGSGAASGLLTATATVASVALDLLIILVLTLYLLSGFPKIKAAAYRLVPASRRVRVTDLGDKVLKQMGGYLSGATIIAIQAGLVAGIFAAVIGLPYPWAIGLARGGAGLHPGGRADHRRRRDDADRLHPGRRRSASSPASSTCCSTCSRPTGCTRG